MIVPEQFLIYVVDDDVSVREAISSLIRSVGLRVQTFVSASDFLEAIQAAPPLASCLVLDIRMPGMSGLELQDEISKRGASIPIIFITGHGDIPMAVRAMKAGASEFLSKPFREQDLLDAINATMTLNENARLMNLAKAEVRKRYEHLTLREKEVLPLLRKGYKNKQIAAELGISEVTVKVHRHNLMEKMEAESLAALLSMCESLSSDHSVL